MRAVDYQAGMGIQSSAYIPMDVSDEQLAFLAQIGVTCGYAWPDEARTNAGAIRALRDRLRGYGIRLYSVATMHYGKGPAILMGLPGREKALSEFADFVKMIGDLDIHTTVMTWEPYGMLCTTPEHGISSDRLGGEQKSFITRGGAATRLVDAADIPDVPPAGGERRSRREILDNFRRLADVVLPAAEQAGVRIALHPNDPPMDSCLGVASLIRSARDYDEVFRLAGSAYMGMELCVGCWLEGGEGFGNVMEDISRFVAEGRVFNVHFRNVQGQLPRFYETFLDNGGQNMYRVMKRLVEAGYEGPVTLDHSPRMSSFGGNAAENAFGLGYIRALYQAAADEMGK